MKQFITKLTSTAVVAGALSLALISSAPLSHSLNGVAQAQQSVGNAQRTITVVGEGKVNVEPNIARINIGVDVLRPTVKEASDANKEVIDAVLKTLMELGIERKDIQTSGFSVYSERYGEPSANGELPPANYRVSNTVSVRIRNLEKVGEALDAVITAGANNIYGVEFSIDDFKPSQSAARKEAIASARAKAEEIAELAGVKVGNVLSVSEVIGGGYNVYPFANAAPAPLGGGGATAIQPGQLEVMTSLQVIFEIVE